MSFYFILIYSCSNGFWIWKLSPENFIFLLLRVFQFFTSNVCEMFLYEHTETIEDFKKLPTF